MVPSIYVLLIVTASDHRVESLCTKIHSYRLLFRRFCSLGSWIDKQKSTCDVRRTVQQRFLPILTS